MNSVAEPTVTNETNEFYFKAIDYSAKSLYALGFIILFFLSAGYSGMYKQHAKQGNSLRKRILLLQWLMLCSADLTYFVSLLFYLFDFSEPESAVTCDVLAGLTVFLYTFFQSNLFLLLYYRQVVIMQGYTAPLPTWYLNLFKLLKLVSWGALVTAPLAVVLVTGVVYQAGQTRNFMCAFSTTLVFNLAFAVAHTFIAFGFSVTFVYPLLQLVRMNKTKHAKKKANHIHRLRGRMKNALIVALVSISTSTVIQIFLVYSSTAGEEFVWISSMIASRTALFDLAVTMAASLSLTSAGSWSVKFLGSLSKGVVKVLPVTDTKFSHFVSKKPTTEVKCSIENNDNKLFSEAPD